MPKYKYIVINQESNQLEGTIGSPDIESARHELNELGFSVVSIYEVHEDTVSENTNGLTIFEFAAIDKNQKKVIGTIQAEERYTAFKRLISEYSLQVEYIIDSKLPEEKKAAERAKGAYDLYQKIEEEQIASQEKISNEQKDLKEFSQQQDILKQQIEFVLNKVKELLDQYEHEMNPETKTKIRTHVDKLLRIKTSTNLDYVRNTAEELLKILQQEEIFMNAEIHLKEKTRLLVDAKSMTMQLRRSKSKPAISIFDELRNWRQSHIYDNPNPNNLELFLNAVINIFIGTKKESSEIISLRKEIQNINSQLGQYLKIYLEAPNPEFKAETRESIGKLWTSRKKLKKELSALKKKNNHAQKITSDRIHMLAEEVLSFTGWMLFFYLFYYFISLYITTKDFGFQEIPGYLQIFQTSFLKYIIAITFLLHGAISVKINLFRKNEIATIIIAPIFIFSSLMLLINF